MAAEVSWVRQEGIIPVRLLGQKAVTLIGAGSVGSFTAIALAKMGFGEIDVFDPDTVSGHNLPNQHFEFDSIGKSKASETACVVQKHIPSAKVRWTPRYYQGQKTHSIIVSAIDSMEGRHSLWNHLKKKPWDLYIDTRMGAEATQIYLVPGLGSLKHVDERQKSWLAYEAKLFRPEQTYQAPCTEKSTIYGASGTAAWVCSLLRRHLTDLPIPFSVMVDWVDLNIIKTTHTGVDFNA